jgi:hypothetical protein
LIVVLFWLLVGHALADYPLQGEFLAKAKHHRNPIGGVPFYHALLAHAFIHAGAVVLVTGTLWLGLAELLAHVFIDYAKCAGCFRYGAPTAREYIGPAATSDSFASVLELQSREDGADRRAFNIDQALHVLCKIVWAALAVTVL